MASARRKSSYRGPPARKLPKIAGKDAPTSLSATCANADVRGVRFAEQDSAFLMTGVESGVVGECRELGVYDAGVF